MKKINETENSAAQNCILACMAYFFYFRKVLYEFSLLTFHLWSDTYQPLGCQNGSLTRRHMQKVMGGWKASSSGTLISLPNTRMT